MVLAVALLNLIYGIVEFIVGVRIGSVSLFANSVDFFEDACVNLLILLALRWSLRNRARLGMVLAGILFIPAVATIWVALGKFANPTVPEALGLGVTALGALAVNILAAFLLVRHRHGASSLTRAAWLSARNDALANLGMIAAAIITFGLWRSAWPDLFVGLVIFALNLDAARAVWTTARSESAQQNPTA